MGANLPQLSRLEFDRRLVAVAPEPLGLPCLEKLFLHYEELRRWNPTLSLVGPGTQATVAERHYGEALAALPFLPAGQAGTLVDLGSGAGFPGFVLAALRPELRVTLVEARERKWSFLASACRRAALPCQCLNARVELPLPVGLPAMFDVLTLRALKLTPRAWEALLARLSPGGRVLWWTAGPVATPPAGLRESRWIALAGSERRRVVELWP